MIRRKKREVFSLSTLIFPVICQSIKTPLFIYRTHKTVYIKAVTSLNATEKGRYSRLIRVQDKMGVGCESASRYCVAQATQIFRSEVSYVLKPYRGKCSNKSVETLHTVMFSVACRHDSFVYRVSHRVAHSYISAA